MEISRKMQILFRISIFLLLFYSIPDVNGNRKTGQFEDVLLVPRKSALRDVMRRTYDTGRDVITSNTEGQKGSADKEMIARNAVKISFNSGLIPDGENKDKLLEIKGQDGGMKSKGK